MFYIFVFCLLFSSFAHSIPNENDETNFKCGISKALNRYNEILNNGNRIMGGVVSPPHFWPWMAALRGPTADCSGEIIGKRWILSAAHCAEEAETGFFIVGTNNMNRINNKTKYEIKQHYLPPNNYSDIMLVELARDLEYGRDISPICISRSFEPSEGERAIVAGFGLLFIEYDEEEGTGAAGESTNLLHEGIVTIKNASECKVFTNETEGVICAGGINRGVMSGDSGGPIMGIKDKKFYLFGTVSEGRAFEAEEGDPLTVDEFDTYTTVSLHCDWIEEITKGDVKCEN